MKITEIFTSINGEGLYQGYPVVFIRTSGCNLRCSYCDTTYSYTGGEELSVEEIVEKAAYWGINRVTITGGEPLAQHDELNRLVELLLYNRPINVEVETNGSYPLALLPSRNRLTRTMDWKLPSSGMEQFMMRENLAELGPADVLKFVCSDLTDLYYAKELLEKEAPNCNIIFSPVFGKMDPQKIVKFLLENNLDCKLQLQIHKLIWEPNRRGV